MFNNKRIKELEVKVENLTKQMGKGMEACTICSICDKMDFAHNLVKLDYLQAESLKLTMTRHNYNSPSAFFYHKECAKIEPSDDGQGWNKVK